VQAGVALAPHATPLWLEFAGVYAALAALADPDSEKEPDKAKDSAKAEDAAAAPGSGSAGQCVAAAEFVLQKGLALLLSERERAGKKEAEPKRAEAAAPACARCAHAWGPHASRLHAAYLSLAKLHYFSKKYKQGLECAELALAHPPAPASAAGALAAAAAPRQLKALYLRKLRRLPEASPPPPLRTP
jgi:hypothetical protein